MAHKLFIDIESRGRPRLDDVGAFVYAEHPDTSILGIGAMLDEAPVHVVATHRGDRLPGVIQDALADPKTRIVSWGEFDRVLLHWAGLGEVLGWPRQSAAQWVNAMDIARASNLPAALDAAACALGLTAGPDAQKDRRGKALIKKFSVPQKTTGQFLELADYPDDARVFLQEYLPIDVRLMARLVAVMPPLSPHEVQVAEATWRMNVTGVGIDAELATALLRFRAWLINTAQIAAQERHAVNLRSTPQLHQAFMKYAVRLPHRANGKPTTSKELLRRTLATTTPTTEAVDLFELRSTAGGTSLAKAQAALAYRCRDGRARGLFVYSGARTGRWASRGLQLQNLPRPRVKLSPPDVETLVSLLTVCEDPAAAATLLELLFAAPAQDLAVSALRSLVIPAPGNVLAVSDLKMIEVVTNWSAAGEVAGLASLAAGNDEYVAYARDLLARVDTLLTVAPEPQHVALRVARDIIDRSLRDIGKTGLLSIQYGTSAHGLARQSNIPVPLAALMIENYGARYPAVVEYQRHLVEAAITAMQEDGSWRLPPLDLQFRRRAAAAGTTLDYLEMVRPSGEAVRYLAPEVVQRQRGNVVDQLICHSVVKGSVLLRRELRLSEQAEHCASSIARDALADALVRADAAGWLVVLAVHDELVIETPAVTADQVLRDLLALMTTKPIWWDPKAPLAAEGAVIPRYQKI